MRTHRATAVLLAAPVVVVGLAFVGSWERDEHAERQARGMRAVLGTIGPLDGPTLSAFRYLPRFQCLGYRRGSNPVALELCVDAEGRVVEAFDRRGVEPEIWSLREDPERSTVRVDRAQVDRLLVRMGVPPRLLGSVPQRAEP